MGRFLSTDLEAGIPQYWIVDREARTIEVNENLGDRWRAAVTIDAVSPKASVVVGDHGTVDLDVRQILSEYFEDDDSSRGSS